MATPVALIGRPDDEMVRNVKIPGSERAIADESKIRDYLLSPDHRIGSAKARFFSELGFDQSTWTLLQTELLRWAAEEAQLGTATRFGQKYVVTGTIHGPSGRTAQLVVVWIVLAGEDVPRLVTAFPGAKS